MQKTAAYRLSGATILASAAMLLAWIAAARCSSAQQPDANDDESRKTRLKFMKDLRDEFQLFRETSPDKALQAVEEPVQRWTNPIRNFFSDGCLFLWLDNKRPAAAATVSIRGNGSVWFENATFSSIDLRCLRNDREYWIPRAISSGRLQITDRDSPAATARARLVQMRRLAEEFAVRTEPVNEQPTELRLMPQPAYRYEDSSEQIIDGALFAFVEATDPEVLLLVEAIAASGGEAASWRCTFAKMTSRPTTARRKDKVVWSVSSYWLNPRSPNDAYQERQLTVYPPPIK